MCQYGRQKALLKGIVEVGDMLVRVVHDQVFCFVINIGTGSPHRAPVFVLALELLESCGGSLDFSPATARHFLIDSNHEFGNHEITLDNIVGRRQHVCN